MVSGNVLGTDSKNTAGFKQFLLFKMLANRQRQKVAVPLNLTFVVRSRAYILGKLVSSACNKEDLLVVGCQRGVRSISATADLLTAVQMLSHFGIETFVGIFGFSISIWRAYADKFVEKISAH
ncbi:hypothetical protein Prudu_1434S001200 [Prunus dulcis]|uniref:Uncharacterized protein n=1 Tax=Prunus dulcis TaxID=3755 RepID=A0A5H2YFS7_PRUDU|nr:hypothetical protein Prudu_1434S001200 [Prunus dulcis]